MEIKGININDIPPEIKDAIMAKLRGGRAKVDRKPLFMLKDHSDIERAFEIHGQIKSAIDAEITIFKDHIDKEIAAFEKRCDDAHTKKWEQIEKMMAAKNLLPAGYDPESDKTSLEHLNGVMFLSTEIT